MATTATRLQAFVPARPATQRAGLALWWHLWGIYHVFMAPFLILFVVFVVAPVLTAAYLSFTYFNVLEPPRWIG